MKRFPAAFLGLLAVAAVFFVGLAQLFSLRFAAGDAYPPGSSRRSDPRGTRVLHDSLASLSGYRVMRNYESLSRLAPDPAGHTLFLFGYDSELLRGPVPKSVADELETFARQGGRLVLAVSYARALDLTNAWVGVRRTLRKGPQGEEGPATRILAEDWGFKLENGQGASGEAIHGGSVTTLPPRLPWAGVRRFDAIHASWQVLYARDGESVVMQRPLGRGTLVLLADDFVVSNEALRHRREPEFLAWLVGSNRRIIFEETHLGLSQEPGLASLVGRYRLGGAVAGLLLLAGLYLWQQAVPFLPRTSTTFGGAPAGGPPPVLGRDAGAGFRNLLRQAVAPSDLLPLVYSRWKDSVGRHLAADRLQDAQDVINLENARAPRDRDPVGTYQKLAAVLNPRSR